MPASWPSSADEASRLATRKLAETDLSTDTDSSSSGSSGSSRSDATNHVSKSRGGRTVSSTGRRRRVPPSSSTVPDRRAPRYGYDWANYNGPAVVDLKMVEAASGVCVPCLPSSVALLTLVTPRAPSRTASPAATPRS